MQNVVSSAAEAETGGIFIGGQQAVPIITVMYKINHPQPANGNLNSDNPVTPQTLTNSYKPLQTITNHLLHKPSQTVKISVWNYGIAVSTVTAHSRNDRWHFSAMTVRI